MWKGELGKSVCVPFCHTPKGGGGREGSEKKGQDAKMSPQKSPLSQSPPSAVGHTVPPLSFFRATEKGQSFPISHCKQAVIKRLRGSHASQMCPNEYVYAFYRQGGVRTVLVFFIYGPARAKGDTKKNRPLIRRWRPFDPIAEGDSKQLRSTPKRVQKEEAFGIINRPFAFSSSFYKFSASTFQFCRERLLLPLPIYPPPQCLLHTHEVRTV